MRIVFFISIAFIFLEANSLPLVQYDPFYKSQKILHAKIQHKSYTPKPIQLNAIFNHRAYINNRFYAVGEKVQGYKIKKIYKQSVVLQNHSRVKILHLQKKHFIQTQHIIREEK